MFTLEELQAHQERIMEAVTVTTAMLSAVVAQLENQSISFTP